MIPFNWFKFPGAIPPKHHIPSLILLYISPLAPHTIQLPYHQAFCGQKFFCFTQTIGILFRRSIALFSTHWHSNSYVCFATSTFSFYSHIVGMASWQRLGHEISLHFTVVRDTGFYLEEFKSAISSGVVNLLFLLQFNMSLFLSKRLQALFSSISFFFLREYCSPYLDVSKFLAVNLCDYISLIRISIWATVSIDILFFLAIWGLKQNMFNSLND